MKNTLKINLISSVISINLYIMTVNNNRYKQIPLSNELLDSGIYLFFLPRSEENRHDSTKYKYSRFFQKNQNLCDGFSDKLASTSSTVAIPAMIAFFILTKKHYSCIQRNACACFLFCFIQKGKLKCLTNLILLNLNNSYSLM